MVLLVKGLEIKQLEKGRILLRFNHVIDKQRTMEGCPWSLERNVLMLNTIEVFENPMLVSMEECDFFVHVHNLPSSMMNLSVATLMGIMIGSFRDLEVDDSGCSWGATLRIRVGLNINRDLKRALRSNRRLGRSCWCGSRLDSSEDPALYGPWLRAPVSGKGRFQGTSHWKQSSTTPSRPQSQSGPRGATIFGSFRKKENEHDPGRNSENQHLRGYQSNSNGGGDSTGEEVESSPPAVPCRDRVIDTDRLPILGMVQVEQGRIVPKEKLNPETEESGCGVGSAIEGSLGDPSHVGKRVVVEQEDDIEINLINVPLQFTTQNNFSFRGGARRGRPFRGIRGRPKKRSRGVQLIELEGVVVHNAKRRLLLSEDTSDSILAETAGQSRREP
ncbi:UNVERIFIED_CONTAM: hypothetical protein Slati_2378500 [Sesamum latifolium]|uniref:DUF4283 domain-containing protein n=1 Tax=Sesamum latifolium TaxID=2727402 RepID=A0AAW2WB23_9LAMI